MNIIINKIKNKETILFTVSFVFILILEIFFCKMGIGDDVVYATALDDEGLFQFLQGRYKWWSSRVFLEAIMMLIQNTVPKIWYVLNALVSAFIVTYSQHMFFKKRTFVFGALFLAAALLLISVNAYGGCGWITCTTNYLWTWAFALSSVYPLIMYIRKEKIEIPVYVISIISSFFAMNNEQMAALLFGCIVSGTLYLLIFEKTKPLYLIPQFAINVFSLWFILSSPGNGARLSHEIEVYVPEFASFSVFEKMMNGFVYCIYNYTNLIPGHYAGMVFLTVLAVYGLIKGKKFTGKLVSLIPVISVLVLSLLKHLFLMGKWNRGLRILELLWSNRMFTDSSEGIGRMIQVVLYILFVVSVVLAVSFATDNKKDAFIIGILYIASVLVTSILGFSPTIIISGERIFLFGELILITVSVSMISKIFKA